MELSDRVSTGLNFLKDYSLMITHGVLTIGATVVTPALSGIAFGLGLYADSFGTGDQIASMFTGAVIVAGGSKLIQNEAHATVDSVKKLFSYIPTSNAEEQ